MAHTPGPWRVSVARMTTRTGTFHSLIDHGDSDTTDPLIAEVYGATCLRSGLDREANAQLIAAAPDLLAALERIAHEPIGPADASHRAVLASVVEIARAAIAVAKGG